MGEKIYTIMNNQDLQQNKHLMGMYAKVRSLLRKFGRVCVPTIDSSKTQVDYFVISDYDGL